MKRLTLNRINAALKAAGHEEILARSPKGYFYFTEGTASGWFESGVYVFHLGSDIEFWINEHASMKAKYLSRTSSNNS
jgi:hypothetical protein